MFFRSPRLWMTVLVVVLVFTITGPFGTLTAMPLLQRFAFWLLLHGMAFSIAIVCAVVSDVALERSVPSRLVRMLAGSALAALPIGVGVSLLQTGFTGQAFTRAEILHQMATSLPLCLALCLLTYLTTSPAMETGSSAILANAAIEADVMPSAVDGPQETGTPVSEGQPAVTPSFEPPAILARLKPENRGRLLRLSVEDHYTQVLTTRGRELVLLRFADALKETGDTPGHRVHRSHWIADGHVESLERRTGRLFIRTRDGGEIPVSRPYEAETRARFEGTLRQGTAGFTEG
jgi:DNA-binding LytR/AlgR family response regulator